MGRMSVATIDAPEFINVTSINPLISQCEIKVLYVGENRNRSFISKEVATKMAESLPGSPIVGYYREDKKDFFDHGDQVVIDGDGVKFKEMTKPYGFVAPDTKIWFQKFEDTDEFGNTEVREYLMTQGYLWTGQYEECKRVIDSGNPQSMKLDDKTLKGYWSTEKNSGIDFFIINDAIFQNLCILGESVEPCFEGADVTAPKVSSNFSKSGEDFAKTLYTMMQELKFALNNKEGGNLMDNQNAENPIVEEPVVEQPTENFSNKEGKVDETPVIENQTITEEFKKEEKPEEDKPEDKTSDDSKDSEKPVEKPADKEEEDKKKKVEENACGGGNKDDKKKYELLEQEHSELQTKFSELEGKYNDLVAKFEVIETAKKDDLISSFYMLSDEDKKDVIDNKSKYSLEDIEAKLSVICVRKKVNFDLDSNKHEAAEKEKEEAPMTYSFDGSGEASNIPAWIKAVEDTKKRLNK